MLMLEKISNCSNLLVGEGQEDMFLCASSTGHVLLLIVKLVAAGLGAADELRKTLVLMVKRKENIINV